MTGSKTQRKSAGTYGAFINRYTASRKTTQILGSLRLCDGRVVQVTGVVHLLNPIEMLISVSVVLENWKEERVFSRRLIRKDEDVSDVTLFKGRIKQALRASGGEVIDLKSIEHPLP